GRSTHGSERQSETVNKERNLWIFGARFPLLRPENGASVATAPPRLPGQAWFDPVARSKSPTRTHGDPAPRYTASRPERCPHGLPIQSRASGLLLAAGRPGSEGGAKSARYRPGRMGDRVEGKVAGRCRRHDCGQ